LALLSIIIPVFNERHTVANIVERVIAIDCEKEIVVIDDGSTDGTDKVLSQLCEQYPKVVQGVRHGQNQGKGAAIKTALQKVTGDVVIIQDGDLEYHPEDYPAAIRLITEGFADAVYGSRFLGPHRVFLFWHYLGNKALTTMANIATSGVLTDMETGFKVIRADVLRRLGIQSYSFDFEVEVTVKLFRHGYRVYEIPITYTGRDYSEGKKITWKDGMSAMWALLKWSVLTRRVKKYQRAA
jgi:glycosyltransferase involved in cell wall biosynthesis